MRIVGVRRLRGPNVYHSRPVFIARVHLEELTERETTAVPGFTDRLLAALPGLADHHCAAGRPGGFVDRLRGGTYFGHVAEHVALELSTSIGREVSFGRTTWAGEPGLYDVATECPRDEPPESDLPEALLRLAIDGIQALLDGHAPSWSTILDALRDQYERERPGPSTAALARAARQRGIPVERVGDLSLLRLGYGRHRRLVWAAMTDATSAIGCDIASDKQLTRQLLSQAGIPVPDGDVAYSADQAVELFASLGAPVVVKPRHGCQGQHVSCGVTTEAEVRRAYQMAAAHGPVVVEREFRGRDYRVLTVCGRVVAAAERCPAHVVGDGRSTIVDLVARANGDPRRGDGHARALTRLTLDDTALAVLAAQGLGPESIPAAGRRVWLRRTANLSTGGTSRDVTDQVHPDVVELAVRTASVLGLDIAGIDLRLEDIAAPLPPTGLGCPTGGVIEVNAAPGLRMHLSPSFGTGRDVASAIVEAVYPPGSPSRIPTVAVTGTNGKTTVTRLIGHLMAADDRTVGLTTTDGVWIGNRLIHRADATGPGSARMVLTDPSVDVAVLETARGGVLRRGLGYDWTDVGVITNIDVDHIGQDGVTDLADLIDVKALIAERVADGGTLVLNADCPHTRSVVDLPGVRAAHKRVAWFSLRDDPLPGDLGYVVQDGWLVQRSGDASTRLLPVTSVPGSFSGTASYAVANALAAIAAAVALGLPAEVAAQRLASFDPWTGNPGRAMRWRLDDVDLLVDYAHNPAGITTMARTVGSVWGADRGVAVVTLPGDRPDDLLAASARAVAEGFSRIVFYEDIDPRGRIPGQTRELLRQAALAHRPEISCVTATDLADAVSRGLAAARPGDVVLLLYEKLDPVTTLLERLGATPVTQSGAPVTATVDAVRETVSAAPV